MFATIFGSSFVDYSILIEYNISITKSLTNHDEISYFHQVVTEFAMLEKTNKFYKTFQKNKDKNS